MGGGRGPADSPSGPLIDAHELGSALEPALLEACGGRLSGLRWFRTDWQLGGAATAYGSFLRSPGNPPVDVVVKLPIGPKEHRLLVGLSATPAPTPRVAAHGTEIGGYDFAWVVMERLPGNPLSGHLHKEVFERLIRAAVGFYDHASRLWSLEKPPDPPEWSLLLDRAREAMRANTNLPRASSWGVAIKDTQKILPRLQNIWNTRPVNTWCHGDLHPGNCMQRTDGVAWDAHATDVLFDLAEVHAGHWVEDAVYLERLYWGKPGALDGVKPVSLLARARREAGLDTTGDYALLANVRRVLMAASAPAFLHHEGHPAYLEAALGTLERLLPLVAK